MRIVQVSVGSVKMPPTEGSAPLQVIFQISKQLASMGHHVRILDRKYTSTDPSVEQVETVEIVRLGVPQCPCVRKPRFLRFLFAEFNAFLFALGVSNYLRRNKANTDVIHLHLTSIGLVVCMINIALRDRMFYTCHLNQWALTSGRLRLSKKVHLFLDAFLMKRVKRIIALNETAKQSFIRVGNVESDKIVTIPNGVDIKFFCPNVEIEKETRRKYGLEGRLTVLFVGRLARIKGVEQLLEAANVVVNKLNYKDVLFILAGAYTYAGVDDPVNSESIFDYIRRHQLGRNVLLTGSLNFEEVRSLYLTCDIFVLPSLAEGDPLVTLEAMASGKPIIGTKVGGIPNQIHDGWNGFLIEPGDERQLTARIKDLLDNPQERKEMGLNSRKLAEEEFDWSKVTGRIVSVYQS